MSTPTKNVTPNWASIREAAAHYGVHRDTIRRLIVSGELYAKRIGPRLIRVDLNSITARPLGPKERTP
ncbi:MAG: helix-turn-helix domain-containing protein [Actinomycetota bacterium]